MLPLSNAGIVLGLTLGAAALCFPARVSSESSKGEPTREECVAAQEQANAMAAGLPADDLSRYFAERDLHQAKIEADNGEFDDCLELAERATVEMKLRLHTLPPGEKLKVLRADE